MNRAFWTAAVAALAWTGCVRDPSLCCDQFSASEERGVYCIAHKDAVVRYITAASDPAEQRARTEWFKGVLKDLEPLPDSDAVHDRLSIQEKLRPDFWREYEKHHLWAGRDTNLPLDVRGRLMVCGFRHGLREIELRLR